MSSQPDPSVGSPRLTKRKRSSASLDDPRSSQRSHLPQDSINPYSYSPSTLLQFSVAGLQDTDKDPSQTIKHFPHSGGDRLSPPLALESDLENGRMKDEDDKDGKAKRSRALDVVPGGHLDVLLSSVYQFLSQGDVTKAARAFGLILQLRPTGKSTDIRHHNLWTIGAEILMRQGEQPEAALQSPPRPKGEQNLPRHLPRRWGSAANLGKVKAYYEELIQQYPYDYKHPRMVAAPDFWLAILGCETYNAHAEQAIALSALEEASREWDDETDRDGHAFEDEPDFAGAATRSQTDRMGELKDEIRLQALAIMKDVSRRLAGLIAEPPYSKDVRFLRLQAMAFLYVGDLLIPLSKVSLTRRAEAEGARVREQEAARLALTKIQANGGELDDASSAFLKLEEDFEEGTAAPLYSSLPIREG